MNLTRLFAYEVYPQKNDENPVAPSGGKIVQSTPLKKTLSQLIRDNRLETQTPIAFTVEDPKAKQRVNVVRESVLNFAFGRGDTVKNNAGYLALRLSEVMDGRSNPFLLLISCFKEGDASSIVLWAFPKDEGLQFSATANGAKVTVIEDVFNISSTLRKAAIFTGKNEENSLWEGRMVDLQSGRTDLWVERFLACRLSVSGVHGTTILSEHLSQAYRQTKSDSVREELFNAIIGVRTAPVRRTSFLKFANDYLGDGAKAEFLSIVPSEQQSMSFDFDRETFEAKIGIRVVKTPDQVMVAAPLQTIGNTVKIAGDRIDLSSQIESQYLKAGKRG
ncbi:hypothetical protein SV7mr_31170 [Stieleria bergensis]|uniref:37-kD nucleoid-associated bacterial protein n=1 Tax=Stieleria bergensis TaxID=2528025 RepID=A0A517SWY4_9BACT|nr:hypothetical protein SV7mr_31170 [Planctomycetes bacterium SV_7m_r]